MVRLSFVLALVLMCAESVCAQQPAVNTTVQLPTISNFSINTVVSVPDGGTMFLGGGAGGAAFSSRRLGNRSISRSASRPGVSVSASLIIGSEIDAELDRRGRLAKQRNARPDIHGTEAVQAKASFLSKHLGRGWK